MTKEDVITVFEKELRCYNVECSDVDCGECECFLSDGTLHEAIKAAVDIMKRGE